MRPDETTAQRFRRLLDETRVYAVTDDGLEPNDLFTAVDAILAAGIRIFQFRDKRRPDRERAAIGQRLRASVRDRGGIFIVNDRADLAVAVDADGVHVGQDDLPVSIARQIVGSTRLVGASASYLPEIPQAEADGVDYLGFGAVYPTGTKLDAEFAGLDLLEEACRAATRPVVGIGGISIERAGDVLARGASGVAVVSALFRAADTAGAASALLAATQKR